MTGLQKNSRAERIRRFLADNASGGTALELQAVLADAGLRLTRAQVATTLIQLHQNGSVRLVKVGRGSRYFAADTLVSQLAPVTPFSLPPKAKHAAGSTPVTGYQRQSAAMHDATVSARQPLRDRLQADLAAFLSKPGNQVQLIPRGATAESLRLAAKQTPPGPRPFVINPRRAAKAA